MALTLHSNFRSNYSKLEKSVKSQAFDFLTKLEENPESPGLRIKPLTRAQDKKVRTGRVNDFYRAVLFKLGHGDNIHWILYGFYPHDKGNDIASRLKLDYNPVHGIAEVELVDRVDHDAYHAEWEQQQEQETQQAHHYQEEPAPQQAPEPAPAETLPVQDAVFGDKPLSETIGKLSAEQLHTELGLGERYINAAMAATTVDALFTALENINTPEWQADALLDLAAGQSIEDIQKKLGLGETAENSATPAEDARTEDEKILAGLKSPAASMSFAEMTDADELRRVMEEQDFGAWRVFLHPEQRRYARGNYKGPFRLTGGAGTGKTVVLVHRAVRMANSQSEGIYGRGSEALDTSSAPRVILTTFTSTLAEGLVDQVHQLDPKTPVATELGAEGIYIRHVDALVSDVLRSATEEELEKATEQVLGHARTTVFKRRDDSKDNIWDHLAEIYPEKLPDRGADTEFLADEYEQVVLANGITTEAEYRRVRRPNRGVRLSRGQRAEMWSIFEAYRAQGAVDQSVSWEESRHIAAAVLNTRSNPVVNVPEIDPAAVRAATASDHVLVDEGQDLTHGGWRFLRALAPPARNDLFIAEDAYQRIYGKPIVLARTGIQIVGRARRLQLNYRTTHKILEFAMQILQGHTYVGMEGAEENSQADSQVGYRSARIGTEPIMRGFDTPEDEAEFIAQQVTAWENTADQEGYRYEEMGILVRNNRQRTDMQRRLDELDVKVKTTGGSSRSTDAPVVLTMHRAKGTEFRTVVLAGVNADMIPTAALRRQKKSEEGLKDFELRERALLYVAATRARDELIVTYYGEPSEMLPIR